ncbi:helix-turn-helix domain-containing protein [Ruminococcaceae bacterium OttesenSCG-928-A16]|nr:helix-turn-helix domain-containing protein [Ruminococcaceae bacterium OttesenSCG-928-A16]
MEYTTMGELISDARKAKNLTQKELADQLNITDKAVSKWERGASYPDISTLPKLADILEISSEDLLRCQTQEVSSKPRNSSVGKKVNQMIGLILKAVALAMGVATLVLSIIGEIEPQSAITLLAIGITCLSFSQFHNS